MQRYTFQLSVGVKMDGGKMENGQKPVNGDNAEQQETVKELTEKIEDKIKNQNSGEKREPLYTEEQEKKLLEKYRKLSKVSIERYVKFFKDADVDKLGYLTIQQFAKALRKLGFRGRNADIIDMFVEIDANHDTEITFEEFMNEMTKRSIKSITEEDVRNIFETFDIDKDGFITREELDISLQKKRLVKLDSTIDDMMRRSDHDGDGKLSYNDVIISCGMGKKSKSANSK